MPIIKSAKKRVKGASKARSRNLKTKRSFREALKAYAKALESGKQAEIAKTQADAVSALDIAVKKDVLHKNRAARYKARLAAQAKTAGVKPVKALKSSTAAKKSPTKKSTTKRTTKKQT